MSLAVQAAMLGRLGTALGSPIKASVVSFILGFVLLMTSWLSPQLGTGLTVLVVLVVLIGQVTGGL